ncbi:MAG: hypothetical protein LUC83_09325 [Clostridiales bacterium]|nr:hypothetical protein [Clostridiales bacterium]
MTLQDLNKHLALRQNLTDVQDLYKQLEAKAAPCGMNMDGMPHSTGISDKVGELATQLADLSVRIALLENQVNESSRKVAAFINSIGDERTRTAFHLRFIGGFAWGEVADALGNYTSEASVKARCYCYLREIKKALPRHQIKTAQG